MQCVMYSRCNKGWFRKRQCERNAQYTQC